VDDREVQERVGRVEELLERLEQLDEPARSLAAEAVGGLVELYGEALRRIVAAGALDGAADDELVSHLLLVHDLHPVDVESRVKQALDEVRPYLHSHGGDVALVAVEEEVVRLRLEGSCDGCPSSTATLRLAIEDAIFKAAPEVDRIDAEGVAESKPPLLQIGPLQRRAEPAGEWTVVGALPQLAGGGLLVKVVAGEPVLLLKLDDTPYAYRDSCAACRGSLAEAQLAGAELECRACGRRYDVRRAGRCLDAPQLSLEPVPLLVSDAGIVKLSLRAVVG
jgi:Fe-S cluster biogenesis protein NfuA/nitrite reductase/ring-hydroxylating ferredoxin subunit